MNSSCPTPGGENNVVNHAYEEWIVNNDLVLDWIKATVNNQYQLMLQNCKFTYDGWINHQQVIVK